MRTAAKHKKKVSEMPSADDEREEEEEDSSSGWETVEEGEEEEDLSANEKGEMRTAEDEKKVSEMPTTDQDALRAIRAASTALQKRWPEGESQRSWRGVEWRGDRVQVLDLSPQIGQLLALTNLDLGWCKQLKELPPQIGQLTALTKLDLDGCTHLKELPPQVGQLLALTSLALWDCEQLTLAPGAEKGQPAQTIVAAYANLLIVAPRKDAPSELHAFLRANPLAVPPLFKVILTDAAHAAWLGKAVRATPELAKLTDAIGRRAIDAAHPACKREMQAAFFLLGRFDVDDGPLLHRSATAAVAAAADHGDPEAKPVPRVALKAMRGAEQVRAELEGRTGLDPKYVIAIKAVYADEEAVDADAWEKLERAAAGLKDVELQRVPGLSRSIQVHLFPSKQEMDQASAAAPELKRGLSARTLATSSEYKLLIVLELADRNLKHTIDHEHIAAKDWPAIRLIASHLGWALDHVHAEGGIHADLKPLNAVGNGYMWKLIDFDVFCKVGEPFGNKIPSSGYCPPEMAKVLLAAIDQDTGEVDTSLLKEYVASEAYDLWSFGVVLYHLCFGRPLWLTDINDNVTPEDLRKLADASDAKPLRKVLDDALYDGVKPNAPNDLKVATALLRKLLEPDPEKRLANFQIAPRCMQGMLDHDSFFKAEKLDAATLGKISEGVRKVQEVQDEHTALLTTIKKLSSDNKIELLHTRKALMKGIFEATTVLTPTTFIILDEKLPTELSAEEPNMSYKQFEKAMTWVERVATFNEGVIENEPSKVFEMIKEVFGELMTKETMYFYLVDELTGRPVQGDGYPIEIKTPKEIVSKLLPVMQVGMHGMALYNGIFGVARMFNVKVPFSGKWRKEYKSFIEVLKQESSVAKFGAVHEKLKDTGNNVTTRDESLRELQRFFKEHDKDERYAGLRRIPNEDGSALWTILNETEVATQLKKRAGERREEERREGERREMDTEILRAELQAEETAARAEAEAARGEAEAARGEAEAARGEAEAARGEAEAARGEAEAARVTARGEAEAARGEAEGTPFDCWLQLLDALKRLCITQDPEQSA